MTDPEAFAARWLSLREADDVQARSARVRKALLDWVGEIDSGGSPSAINALRVAELGAGTGALLRDLSTHFTGALMWTLIDSDHALLALAKSQLIEWAEAAGGKTKRSDEGLEIQRGALSVTTRFRSAKLTPIVLGDLTKDAQLLVCSAFLDLAGEHFIDALTHQVTTRRLALYASLTYDGRWRLSPIAPVDAATREAFHRDMQRDKGLGGPALGPAAIDRLIAGLRTAGAHVTTGPSDWQLEGASPLARAWLSGVAKATAQPAFSGAHRESVSVGHTDLFAVMP